MATCYYKHDLEIDYANAKCIDSFSDCQLLEIDNKYVIKLTSEVKKYFKELLYYRFLYSLDTDGDLYLVWDSTNGNGLISQEPERSSVRFFRIIKHIWTTNEDIIDGDT